MIPEYLTGTKKFVVRLRHDGIILYVSDPNFSIPQSSFAYNRGAFPFMSKSRVIMQAITWRVQHRLSTCIDAEPLSRSTRTAFHHQRLHKRTITAYRCCYCCDGVRLCVCGTGVPKIPLSIPQIWVNIEQWWNGIDRGKPNDSGRETYPSAALSTWTGLGANPSSAVRSLLQTDWATARSCYRGFVADAF